MSENNVGFSSLVIGLTNHDELTSDNSKRIQKNLKTQIISWTTGVGTLSLMIDQSPYVLAG
jgi:hypothetical protein